jgi:hypothetical protein
MKEYYSTYVNRIEISFDEEALKKALDALDKACLHCESGDHLEVCPISRAKLALTPDPSTNKLWTIEPK